jgi:hypothetical protein
MRWRNWRVLVHAHNAMAERWEVVVNRVGVRGRCAGGGGDSSSLRDLLLCGWSSECWLVAIWEDASAIGVKVCVFQDRAPTHVAGRWMDGIYTLMLQDAVTTTLLQRQSKQLRELSFTARAVCCSRPTAAFCARQAIHHFWGD